MSVEQMKVFSIERRRPQTSGGSQSHEGGLANDSEALGAILEAISRLERRLDGVESAGPPPTASLTEAAKEELEEHTRKIELIQSEVADIAGRIRVTKAEIAALRHPLAQDDKFEVATAELGGIVQQTENATNSIMSSGEAIEEAIAELLTQVDDEYANSVLGDIADHVIKIYEACNFQDLTGQRINKVINVVNYIEERVDAMIKAWDVNELATMPLPESTDRQDGDVTLAGPALEDNQETIDQDAIDALFD